MDASETFDGAPADTVGMRYNDIGTVIADWFGENVKVAFDDGDIKWVSRAGVQFTDPDDLLHPSTPETPRR